jgi:acetyl-CoA carboxylase biotin carboxylase subunit
MKEINSILIANRGEIASRIMRTCRRMGIKTIAVFSEADRKSLFVSEADTAVFIGGSNPSESYLDTEKIMDVIKKTGADAVHPGYGFLSENVAFAERCEKEGVIFIGPHPGAIRAMGSKSEAKSLMSKSGVPVVPGYQGEDQSKERLLKEANAMGYPVLLKAAAGGGGKGMRIVHSENEIETAINAAKRESKSAFGDDELIIEKYIASGRHIEFQIFGDKHNNALHILERECTIQRRYQKVIEESPSPIMDEKLRNRMGEVAVNAAKALKYDNAGTVEFIYDDKTGDFYFLEVNTRLQVEHPVTEEVTGLDLVQMQIESAQGLPLTVSQDEIKGKGYAIECRLYAEDASNDFMPVTGTVERFEFPKLEGLRVETAIQSGSEISVFYDPMIAKLIVWDKDRPSAQRKMIYVLKNLVCIGMTTNQDFLLHLMQNKEFREGKYDTHFIQKKIDLTQLKVKTAFDLNRACISASLHSWAQREKARTALRSIPSGWRNNFTYYQQDVYIHNSEEILVKYRHLNKCFKFLIDDIEYIVALLTNDPEYIRCEIEGVQYQFTIVARGQERFVHNQETGTIALKEKNLYPVKEAGKIKGGYEAPIPSQIIKVLVEKGQKVKSGDSLLILSSMKMENMLIADDDGVVEDIYVQEGGNVVAGTLLLKINGLIDDI